MGSHRKKRPPKHTDVLLLMRALLAASSYRDTPHASGRSEERRITLQEARQVLETGWHEKSKDEYKEDWKAWNYAIRGKTLDGRNLRVAVSFEAEDTMLVIVTKIDLDAKGGA